MSPVLRAFIYIASHFPLVLVPLYTVIFFRRGYIPHGIFDIEVYEDFVVMRFVQQTPIGTNKAATQVHV